MIKNRKHNMVKLEWYQKAAIKNYWGRTPSYVHVNELAELHRKRVIVVSVEQKNIVVRIFEAA